MTNFKPLTQIYLKFEFCKNCLLLDPIMLQNGTFFTFHGQLLYIKSVLKGVDEQTDLWKLHDPVQVN